MATDFILPNLGENIETIQVANILVSVGDSVTADQPLMELETDKATIEVPSDVAATVGEITVAVGDDVQVGQVVLRFSDTGAAPGVTTEAKAETTEESSAEPTPEPSATVATETLPAPGPVTAASSAASEPTTPASSGALVPAAPSVRKFAREIGIALNDVSASGPQGRVTIEDVKRHAKSVNEGCAVFSSSGAAMRVPSLPDFAQFGEVKEEKMTPIRFKTASQMALAWSQVPHVTIFDNADITELEPLRKKYADKATALGGKLTMAVMVCKVAASALKQFPKFNTSIDMASKKIINKKFINLGVAVATPKGLMVPVLRNADQMNMVEMAAAISTVAAKARDGKIQMEDLQGGTFTVTNLGRVGGRFFTPIVNHPEVAILGMGRTYLESSTDGNGTARVMLPLSLSFDHRIIDGSDGAAFLGWILEALQEPLVLALEG